MKLETKFNVGETVIFISDNIIKKGVITKIFIEVRPAIWERYEVKYFNECHEEEKDRIEAESLFGSEKELIDKLLLDFEKSEKENE